MILIDSCELIVTFELGGHRNVMVNDGMCHDKPVLRREPSAATWIKTLGIFRELTVLCTARHCVQRHVGFCW